MRHTDRASCGWSRLNLQRRNLIVAVRISSRAWCVDSCCSWRLRTSSCHVTGSSMALMHVRDWHPNRAVEIDQFELKAL
ncbi:hypothetical protein SESBI_43544, partial [Sesbania bispinosa]